MNSRTTRLFCPAALAVVVAYGGAFFLLRKGMSFTFIVTTSEGDQVFRTAFVFYFFKDQTTNYVAYCLFSPMHSWVSDDERDFAKAVLEGEEDWLKQSGRKAVYVSDTDLLRRCSAVGFR